MTTTKEIIQERAKHFLELRQAEAQLLEIERQEQAQRQQAQQQAQLSHAHLELGRLLGDFQTAKAESDSAILAWVEQGISLIEQRHGLGKQSIKVSEAARSLAYALLSNGQGNPALAGFGQSDAVKMQSEELLKAATGHSQLMTLPAGNEHTGYLLNCFCQITGDAMIKK